jgi:hypothetical protein
MQGLVDKSSVPLIGQQLHVEGYTIAIAARCQCDRGGTSVLISVTSSASGTAITAGVCPRCQLSYSIHGMELDAQARLKFAVAVLSANHERPVVTRPPMPRS